MRFSHQEIHTFSILDTLLAAIAKTVYNVALALPHHGHVHRYRASLYTVVSGPASQIGHSTTGNHGFSGRAALINASTTDMYPLYDGGSPSSFCQRGGERASCLSGTNYNCIILCCCHSLVSPYLFVCTDLLYCLKSRCVVTHSRD